MITEDEAMRLLKRADPARVDDATPYTDGAGYLSALRTRSTTVTLIDIGPTPTRRPSRQRWLIAAAAAVVVAVVVGGLVLATRDDPDEQIPAASILAPDAETSAAEVVRGFLDAYVANDADRALTYLTDDAVAAHWGSPEEFRREIAWNEAAKFNVIVNDCEQRDGGSEAGLGLRCGFDHHVFGSDALGIGPFGDNYWDLTVRDGKIVSAPEWVLPFSTNGFSDEIWEPFARWIRTEHPDDVLVMYTTAEQILGRNTQEAVRLWEQRTDEYVQAVLTGPETYAADVGAICATQAARLGELAVPAEGALDQVAAWNTVAAAIIHEAHGELIALDKPPLADTMAYTNFYGGLARLTPIVEESAEAATAGDAARLAELNAEYREVRQAMSSGPTGAGLEECLVNLPS